jgi:hypothetical protein
MHKLGKALPVYRPPLDMPRLFGERPSVLTTRSNGPIPHAAEQVIDPLRGPDRLAAAGERTDHRQAGITLQHCVQPGTSPLVPLTVAREANRSTRRSGTPDP